MVDKSKLAIATSQIQNPIPFLIELFFNLLSQMITVSTIKLTSQPVSSIFVAKINRPAAAVLLSISETLALVSI